MRGLIILCFTAVAFAAPQGYNYNPGVRQQSGGITSFNTFSGLTGFAQSGQQKGQFSQSGFNQQQQQPIVTKRFYIHSAPEDIDDELMERYITVGVPRKTYNVVFIKSAQRNNKKTGIKISPAVNEEKTIIYVLNKKTDSSDVQTEVIENAAPVNKPEVFFIKYKTSEEAAQAQQQIQTQYDALGGTSQVLDEGVGTVTSVIGSVGGGDVANVGSVGNVIHGGGRTVVSAGINSNAYLPPT